MNSVCLHFNVMELTTDFSDYIHQSEAKRKFNPCVYETNTEHCAVAYYKGNYFMHAFFVRFVSKY